MAYIESSPKVKPPIRGSFPLDHDGECKQLMVSYMTCLKQNTMSNSNCREAAKEYFSCRMQKGLMTREAWDTLGYGEFKDRENSGGNNSL